MKEKRKYKAQYKGLSGGLKTITVLAEDELDTVRRTVKEFGLDGIPLRDARGLIGVGVDERRKAGRKKKRTPYDIRAGLRRRGYPI